MSAACRLSMKTWERYNLLLLCACPRGTEVPGPIHEQCWLLPSMGPGGSWGWGLNWLRQSPFCSPMLRGCVFLEALSTAKARELWLVQVPECFHSSGAGSTAPS